MAQLKNYREVGIFDLMSAPLNPIGAFDAEQFKKDVRALLADKQDEQFLAVDLTGLDFVYSDAYNAFIQFQQEMEDRHGLFAVLTNNQTIIDGLKKVGLDKNIKVFSYESDMMSFSLHAQAPEKSDETAASAEEPARPVASQNMSGEPASHHLNWFIPALVNIRVGSSLTTIGAEGTIRCSLLSKKLLKESRISLAVIISYWCYIKLSVRRYYFFCYFCEQ